MADVLGLVFATANPSAELLHLLPVPNPNRNPFPHLSGFQDGLVGDRWLPHPSGKHGAEEAVPNAVGASMGLSVLNMGGFVKKTLVCACLLSPSFLTWVVVNKELLKGF